VSRDDLGATVRAGRCKVGVRFSHKRSPLHKERLAPQAGRLLTNIGGATIGTHAMSTGYTHSQAYLSSMNNEEKR
jgi:hypothetical protein